MGTWARDVISLHMVALTVSCVVMLGTWAWAARHFPASDSTGGHRLRLRDQRHANASGAATASKAMALSVYLVGMILALAMQTTLPWQGWAALGLTLAGVLVLLILASVARIVRAFPRRRRRWWSIVELSAVLLALGLGARYLADDFYRCIGVPIGRIDVPTGQVVQLSIAVLWPVLIAVLSLILMWVALGRWMFAPMNWLMAAISALSFLTVVTASVGAMEHTANNLRTEHAGTAYGLGFEPVCVSSANGSVLRTAGSVRVGSHPTKMWRLGSYGAQTVLAARLKSPLQPLYLPSTAVVVSSMNSSAESCAP